MLALNLPVDMICTSHGVIWRDNPARIVEQYLKWADNYQENQITLVYDSMWNGTRALAENLRAAGFEVVGDGFKALWNPDDQAMGAALDYGKQIAGGLQ